MEDRFCNKCGTQTATAEQQFEIGTAIGVSQEARIEELNSLSECYFCREQRIHEEVRREMDEEEGKHNVCREGFWEGEECPICEHENGDHNLEIVGEEWEGPEYPCPYCENPNFTSKEAREWLRPYIGELRD